MSEGDKSPPRGRPRWTKERHPDPAVHGWKKGQSGSPGGQHGTRALHRRLAGKSGDQAIQKIFRRKSVTVVHALSRIIADKKTPASVRVAAAQLFLERGWGKIEADGVAPKRAKKKDGPIVVVRRTPRSPYNSGDV